MMEIKVDCKICEKSLVEQGALLFSPPKNNNILQSVSVKIHICKPCYDELMAIVSELNIEKTDV